MVQCWRAGAVDEENWYLHMVLYCSHMMYKYYSRLGFSTRKHNENVKDIHNEIFNNVPHFIKNRVCADCIQEVFFIYKNKVTLCKR